jgi:hypothetical protein
MERRARWRPSTNRFFFSSQLKLNLFASTRQQSFGNGNAGDAWGELRFVVPCNGEPEFESLSLLTKTTLLCGARQRKLWKEE